MNIITLLTAWQTGANIDYSICYALKRFPGQHQALIIYDICCQWIIHFHERVSQSEFSELADSMDITGAVGKWHHAAHIPECFPKFSLNFVEGAGQGEGEILGGWTRPVNVYCTSSGDCG